MDIINLILTGGVGVAIITLLGQIILWYLNKNSDIKQNPEVINDFENNDEIKNIMDRVINRTKVARFLILKTENGGGKPRVGSHLYSSVVYESLKDPVAPVKNDYQRILVDSMYIKMLSNISSSTPNKLVVDKMKDGLLKSIYNKERITYAEVYYVAETDNSFYYLSVATTDEINNLSDPNDRVEIEIAVSKIRNIFNKTMIND